MASNTARLDALAASLCTVAPCWVSSFSTATIGDTSEIAPASLGTTGGTAQEMQTP